MAALLWVSTVTPALGQSGDGDGSGFGVSMEVANASLEVGDEPGRTQNEAWVTPSPPTSAPPPTLLYEPAPEKCSVNFHTSQATARRLKAQQDQLLQLKALQRGNQAVMENLIQFVGAELGDQNYEDVIQENMAGVREEHLSCDGMVEKVAVDLEGQLEGDILEALAGIQKIKEESLAFEGMLRATDAIAGRLESSSRSLHASFARRPRDPRAGLHG